MRASKKRDLMRFFSSLRVTVPGMDVVTLALAAVGLIILSYGADLLVRGASRLAQALGISSLVVGLTVVAFGTSAPELAVSIQSAFAGHADLAIGNVVGSNIFNVLLILGVSALITPLVVARQLVRIDVPLLIVVSVAVWVMSLDGSLGVVDGALLTTGIVAYTAFTVRQSRRETKRNASPTEEQKPTAKALFLDVALVVGGLAMLVVGSRWFVAGAVQVAQWLGVSDLVIGLTIVAAGTSLPEVAASVAASLKGERDLAVGNVIGSNLFNLMCVLGISALVSPKGLPVPASALAFDIPVMVAVSVACLPIFFAGHLITRREGAVFLAFYVAYAAYVVLSAQNHALLPSYENVMGFVVLPATVATLVLVTVREIRARRHGAHRA